MSVITYSEIMELASSNKVVSVDQDIGSNLKVYNAVSREEKSTLKYRCIVVDEKEEKVVLQSCPFSPELSDEESKTLDLTKFKAFFAYEGTLVRVWFYNNIWRMSTDRKLNAFSSRWSSPLSFGQLFEQAVKCSFSEFTEKLNKKFVYMFLIHSTNDNRVVCKGRNIVMSVGKFNPLRGSEDKYEFGSLGMSEVNYPVELKYESLEQLRKDVETMSSSTHQGVILFGEDNSQFKVSSKKYLDLVKVRGNEPNVMKRCFQLINDPTQKKALYELYPEKKVLFQKFEDGLTLLSIRMYEIYVGRYLQKQIIYCDKFMHYIIVKVHNLYKSTRVNTSPITMMNMLLTENFYFVDKTVKSLNM